MSDETREVVQPDGPACETPGYDDPAPLPGEGAGNGELPDVSQAEVEAYVESSLQFLMGICDDPATFDYLSRCTVADAYTVLYGFMQLHARYAVAALYRYVAVYYPELTDPEAVRAKVVEVENEFDLYWTPADCETPPPEGTYPQAVLNVYHPETREWVKLYSFGVTMKAVSPETDGVEREGYLPAVVGQVLVTGPTTH